jgi:hypothetical protein
MLLGIKTVRGLDKRICRPLADHWIRQAMMVVGL